MPTAYKILAQSAPAATTPVLLYGPVAASTSTVVSTIAVCNRGATQLTYRISLRQAGEAENVKQYLVFDALLPHTAQLPTPLDLPWLLRTLSMYIPQLQMLLFKHLVRRSLHNGCPNKWPRTRPN